MNGDTDVYDLGDVDRLQDPGSPAGGGGMEQRPAAAARRPEPREIRFGGARERHADPDWTAVPSLVVPGAAHMLRGEFAGALCLLSLTGFTVALFWAIYTTLDRLAPTLELLGIPAVSAVWSLGLLALAAGCIHIGAVYGGARPGALRGKRSGIHPVVAGTASGIVPGLGQLLNGDRGRAVLFLSGLWLVAGSWALVSPWVTGILEAQNLVLPGWLAPAAAPAVRWTLPAVLWTLAVYDAAARAGREPR